MTTPSAEEPATRPMNWAGRDGAYWAEHDEVYEAMLAPLNRHLLAAAAIGPADRVLDVGCGCGGTTRLAARAAPDGEVIGVDVAEPMVTRARQRAAQAGLPNLRHEPADAQTHPFGRFDVVLSRFGVMFFDDPPAAFANLRRTGGRLAFVCWQRHELNQARVLFRTALAPHVELPPLRSDVGATSLSDPARVREVLSAAGWTGIELTDVREPLPAGPTAAAAAEFKLADPGTAEVLAAADPAAAARAAEALRAAYEPYETPAGVYLDSASWLVTAS